MLFFIKLLKTNRRSFLIILLMGLLPLAVSSGVTVLAVRYEQEIRSFGVWEWVALYGISIITMAFSLTPTTFVSLVSGFFIGFWSLPGVVLGYLGASYIGYMLAAFFDGGRLLKSLQEVDKVSQTIENLKKSQLGVIILTRLSPALPFAIMNVVLSVLKIDLRKFLIAGFIGMLPRTLLMIWVGSQAQYIRYLLENPNEDVLLKTSFIALLGLTFFGLTYYIKKALGEGVKG
jgi:uncharacterized membrane protein YdjX (TVP38/TMEM64 family)